MESENAAQRPRRKDQKSDAVIVEIVGADAQAGDEESIAEAVSILTSIAGRRVGQ